MKENHRVTILMSLTAFIGLLPAISPSQESGKTPPVPVQYEELSAPEFSEAVANSGGICVIPIGILEKHGPHLPVGTDLLSIRETVLRAAKQEYCVIFPPYYCGQIFEAKHQPGAISYSAELQWKLLQETCDELGRNGFTKIVLANGHGGNNNFLGYFCQAQLAERKPYSVILFAPAPDSATRKQLTVLRKTKEGGHADEVETSRVMALRPDLVHRERAAGQSGEDLKRLDALPFIYTGIWWYARYPNHYAGDGSSASTEIGNLVLNSESRQLAALIRALKSDRKIKELEDQFFDAAEKPLQTKQ